MTIHALVPQCNLSNLNYTECQIPKSFGALPLESSGEGLQHLPDSPAAQLFSSSLSSSKKNGTPQKLLDMALTLIHITVAYLLNNLI